MTLPTDRNGHVGLRHGGGGKAMRALIRDVLTQGLPRSPWAEIGLDAMDDGACLRVGDRYLVLTTDSHVIQPVFFPGGDIGRLAVAGTVNDLAVMGATDSPILTCAVILEEGFPRADLEQIQASVAATCEEAGATIVTGDTKVMGKGELDGIVINTTGIAFTSRVVPDRGLRPGDRILVTGTVGDHGLAVMATRNDLALQGDLRSDVAPIASVVRAALEAGGLDVVAMKDPTRGGLSSALHEMAAKSEVGVVLDEPSVPLREWVRAASELLGIDPLQVANEGKAVIGVRPNAVDDVLAAIRKQPLGAEAAVVGTCIDEHAGSVILDTGLGRRILVETDGDPLPRIC